MLVSAARSGSVVPDFDPPSGSCSHQTDGTGPAAAAWGKPSILSSLKLPKSAAWPHALAAGTVLLPADHLSPPQSLPGSPDDIIAIIFIISPELETPSSITSPRPPRTGEGDS